MNSKLHARRVTAVKRWIAKMLLGVSFVLLKGFRGEQIPRIIRRGMQRRCDKSCDRHGRVERTVAKLRQEAAIKP